MASDGQSVPLIGRARDMAPRVSPARRSPAAPILPCTAAACARSTARPAGRARTRSRSSCSPPACSSACAARSATRRCASPMPASPCSPRRCSATAARRDAHEALVERVAREMTRAGRLAWRGLSLRAKVDDGWAMAMPDVFSIRHTTVEAYLEPIVHEVKVRRADLLADLRNARASAPAYLQLGGECWYVIREGIAEPDEIPPECGVLVAGDERPRRRPARRRGGRCGCRFRALDGAGAGDAGRRLAPRRRAAAARRHFGALTPQRLPRRSTPIRCMPVAAATGRRRRRPGDARAPRALGRAGADRRLGRQLQRPEGGVRGAVAGRLPVRALPDHAGRRGRAAVLALRHALAAGLARRPARAAARSASPATCCTSAS